MPAPRQQAKNRRRARQQNASADNSKWRAKKEEAEYSDPWSRQLFIALCRRYGIKPFRYSRMNRQTVMVRAPASFVHVTLWPEFKELSPRSYGTPP